MTDIRLSGKLPDGDRAAGLAAQIPDLLEDPQKVRVAILLYDVDEIKVKPGAGTQVPTLKIRAVEPITPSEDADEMRELLVRSVARRTGQTVLPIDLERELKSIFEGGTPDGDGSEGRADRASG